MRVQFTVSLMLSCSQGRALAMIAVLAIVSGCGGGIDQAKFEKPVRAINALKAATKVGATAQDFAGLLREAVTELATLKERATITRERQVFMLASLAVQTYGDSLRLWQHKIAWPTLDDAAVTDLSQLQAHYLIKLEDWKSEGVQQIWAVASAKVDAVNKILVSDAQYGRRHRGCSMG